MWCADRCVAWTESTQVCFCDFMLVKCTNTECSQYDKVKQIRPMYLGSGVEQRLQPVCTSCDGLRDMAIVEEVRTK